ncbi:MAG: riboflavin biosynthesis protein RibF [Dysgonamonadaceae bacterium]|jgi:riboflavin kinase/FMN adenylyltransferase|nr:riboflavin biosynthesis protein RibF [Dysgonamonadaceae bacterium]
MKVVPISDSVALQQPAATTVGFFDGVHRGHRYLIEQLKKHAQTLNLPASVVTFSAHPKKILQPGRSLQLLNSYDERIRQLASTGLDYCYLIPFTQAFSELTAEEFIQKILHKQLNIRFLLIGYDHKFGRGCTQDFADYAEIGHTCGIQVVQAKEWRNPDVSISSTQIRHAVQSGDMQRAAEMLSYPYTLEGIVVEGNHLGRTIGFPTANLSLNESDKLLPPNGVYASTVIVNEQPHKAMTYIGERPTLALCGEKRIETYLFHFNQNLYGQNLRIELHRFIRSDMTFGNLEELRAQLLSDQRLAEVVK